MLFKISIDWKILSSGIMDMIIMDNVDLKKRKEEKVKTRLITFIRD